jgi:hypothetical protein
MAKASEKIALKTSRCFSEKRSFLFSLLFRAIFIILADQKEKRNFNKTDYPF